MRRYLVGRGRGFPHLTFLSPLPFLSPSDSDSAPVPQRCACHAAGRPLSGKLLLSGGGAPQQARGGGPVSPCVSVCGIVCVFRCLTLVYAIPLRSSKELLLQPVIISRNDKEKVLIEGSINSVRVSIAVKQVSETTYSNVFNLSFCAVNRLDFGDFHALFIFREHLSFPPSLSLP